MAKTQPVFFTNDAEVHLDDLLMLICEELQLPPSRHLMATERYQAVSRVLSSDLSPFRGIALSIYPQGSMALGTTVQPVNGPHDLDFVFELGLSHRTLNPMVLLHRFFAFLKGHETYRSMVSLKNRCVRITYANDFYMDVLPSCKDLQSGGTCIQVPDRKLEGWTPSDPLGYVRWFRDASILRSLRIAAAQPVPALQPADEKVALQLVVQLQKRWRDLYYPDRQIAPISIVLTTLAGRFYGGERSTVAALSGVLTRVVAAIDNADRLGNRLVVLNPSNPQEDLSERWDENPKAYDAFRAGMRQFLADWQRVVAAGRETNRLVEKLFGEPVTKAVIRQAKKLQDVRSDNQLGILPNGRMSFTGVGAVALRPNTFHGKK